MPKYILAIDDEEPILRLLKMRLDLEGFKVLCEMMPEKVLEKAILPGVCVVLLDLNVAGVSGFEILAKIKRALPHMPVIMITGSHDEQEARRAIEMGALDYITKPIDFTYLKNLLTAQFGS